MAYENKQEIEDYENFLVLMAKKWFGKSCGVCGGLMIKIRGKYPEYPRREFCPTCLIERLETIIDNINQQEAQEVKP